MFHEEVFVSIGGKLLFQYLALFQCLADLTIAGSWFCFKFMLIEVVFVNFVSVVFSCVSVSSRPYYSR